MKGFLDWRSSIKGAARPSIADGLRTALLESTKGQFKTFRWWWGRGRMVEQIDEHQSLLTDLKSRIEEFLPKDWKIEILNRPLGDPMDPDQPSVWQIEISRLDADLGMKYLLIYVHEEGGFGMLTLSSKTEKGWAPDEPVDGWIGLLKPQILELVKKLTL